MPQKYPFWRPFLALSLLGLIGVLSLLFIIVAQLDQAFTAQPELTDLPLPLLVIISLLQPAILVLIANTIGCLLAPRLGLVSFTYEKAAYGTSILPRLRPQLVRSMALGLIFSVVVVVLDLAFSPFTGEELAAIEVQDFNILGQLGLGILYGGITEELLLRWGVMSLLVWLGWILLRRAGNRPPAGVVWAAILISAVLFGIGHLPAMAAMVPLTAAIVIRTVLLNAIGGVVFGWLYWRRSLESAMIAHAFTHVGFFVFRLLALAFNAT